MALQLTSEPAAAPKASAALTSPPRAKKAKTSRGGYGGANVWSSGTGYGGMGESMYDSLASMYGQPMQQAAGGVPVKQQQQQERDNRAAAALDSVTDCLTQVMEQADEAGLPFAVTSALYQGAVPQVLYLLLSNDCLQEVCGRDALCRSLYHLLQTLGRHIDGMRFLMVPIAPPSTDPEEAPAPGVSLLDLVQRLAGHARDFQRLGVTLANGSNADVDHLGLVLHITEVSEALEQQAKACAALLGTNASAPAAAPAGGASALPSTSAAGQEDDRKRKGRAQKKQTAAERAAEKKQAEAEARAAVEKRYTDTMKPLASQSTDLMAPAAGYYFRSQQAKAEAERYHQMPKVLHQINALLKNLPIQWASSVFVAQDEEKFAVLRALIIGPVDTPYANGCFIFDIFLPPDFPNTPPKVQLLTTGGGKVRFNPNLYACGKVCLSLLGTWSGPSWQPGVSTLLQVLVSIQSMIFVSDPWYNEPGREHRKSDQASANHNRSLQLATLQHAILPALRKPAPEFAQVIRQHYLLKRDEVNQQCDAWLQATQSAKAPADRQGMWGETPAPNPATMQKAVQDVKAALAALT
ncbi:hypothetical protein WJX73_005027 [Symbiochloris irregularis]|uniref:UBC core domain-containing protein n=1 Tax=Symbiochloris irregularis TaxID=706552 RepID=A0AAW1NYF0_9CHLO